MKRESGVRCGEKGTHRWGKAVFCCEHFDLFVESIFELNRAITARRHEDLVEMLESFLNKSTKIFKVCPEPKTEPKKK